MSDLIIRRSFLLCRHILVLGILIIALSEQSMAASLWTKSFPSSPTKASPVKADIDLVTLVQPSIISNSEVYSQALGLLSSMQSDPSCNRAVTASLLTACKSIEGPTNEHALDDVGSIYAAQLAVCELKGAGSQIPPFCNIGLPLDATAVTQSSKWHENVQLRQCLKSLESRPQWWTSYSNNKQNAVVLCQAARVEIEKDELIDLHKSMVRTSSDVEAALIKTIQEANRRMAQQQQFASAIEAFQAQLLRDLAESSAKAQSYLSRMTQNFGSSVENILKRVSNVVETMRSDIVELSHTVRKTNSDSADLTSNIGRVFQQVVQGSSELAATQTSQWDFSRGLAAQLQNSLKSMKNNEISALMGTFSEFNDRVQATNNNIIMMHAQQSALGNLLEILNKSFEKLVTEAEVFHAMQTRQSETQLRQYEHMQTKMQKTSERLAAIDASASSISSNIRDLSSLLAQVASLGGIVGALVRWKWLVVVVPGIAWFSPRYALYTVGAIATFETLQALCGFIPSEIVIVHYASGYELSLHVLLRLFGVLLSIATFLIVGRSRWQWARSGKIEDWPSHTLHSLVRFCDVSYLWRPSDRLVLHTER